MLNNRSLLFVLLLWKSIDGGKTWQIILSLNMLPAA